MRSAEERLARLEAVAEQLDHQVRAIGPAVGQVATAAANASEALRSAEDAEEAMHRAEARITSAIAALGEKCDKQSEERKKEAVAIRQEYIADAGRRSEFRGKIVVAVIAASATVLAAIVAAVAAIVLG